MYIPIGIETDPGFIDGMKDMDGLGEVIEGIEGDVISPLPGPTDPRP